MAFYSDTVERIAKAHGLDPLLVEAVIQQESSGHPDAFRHEPGFFLRYVKNNTRFSGADARRVASSYGLMQVMYPTAVDHGFDGEPEELFLVPINIEIGCRVLAKLMARFKGDTLLVLAAYNGGPGNVHAKIPLEYARKVLLRHATFQQARNSRPARDANA